jgi:formate hydrogenlyase subunit 4
MISSVLAAACLVPLGLPPPLAGVGDVILLLYLLLLSGVCTLLAGAAAGSTYSWIGVSREMMSMMALEPILAVALGVGAVHARSFRLGEVLSGSPYAVALPVSGVIMLVVMLLAFQAHAGRVPFDVAEAETEIMDGPLSEYSGRKLALFRLAQMAKLVVHAALFVALFVPWGAGLPFPLGFLLFWAKVLVLVLLVALVAATHARYRVDQALRRYSVLLACSLVAIALAAGGR